MEFEVVALTPRWSYTGCSLGKSSREEAMNDGLSNQARYSHVTLVVPDSLIDGRELHHHLTMPVLPRGTKRSLPWNKDVLIPGRSLGFTLMELLIVISIILILMLMAMPTVGGIRKHANETSAVNSVQAIVTAEIMYSDNYPAKGFTCSLAALGGDPASGQPTSSSAQLIQSDLTSGHKSGYVFNITNCIKTSVHGGDYVKGYTVTAVPETVGKTGDRGFCIDQNGGSPKYDPAGGTSCTQLLQQ